MLKHLLTVFVFAVFQSFSQNFEYTVKIKYVSTKIEAKNAAPPIKAVFNQAEENYFSKIFFDENIMSFKIASKLEISDVTLVNMLAKYDLILESFEKKDKNN